MKTNQTPAFITFLGAAVIAAAGWWAVGCSWGNTSELEAYFLIFDDDAILQAAMPR
jgi:hypothetical protein